MPYEKEPKKNPSVIKSVVFDTETASDLNFYLYICSKFFW